MRVFLVLCAVVASAWATGYGNQGGSLGGGRGLGGGSLGLGGGSLGLGGGSLGGSLGGGSLGGGSRQGPNDIDINVPLSSETTGNIDLSRVGAQPIGSPQVQVGDLGDAFGHETEAGEISEREGSQQRGSATEQEGDIQVGQPVEQLLGYSIIREHQRIIPVLQVKYRSVPIISTRYEMQPITSVSYRRQPITVRTRHRLEQSHDYGAEGTPTQHLASLRGGNLGGQGRGIASISTGRSTSFSSGVSSIRSGGISSGGIQQSGGYGRQ